MKASTPALSIIKEREPIRRKKVGKKSEGKEDNKVAGKWVLPTVKTIGLVGALVSLGIVMKI